MISHKINKFTRQFKSFHSFFSLGTSVHRYAGNNKAPTLLVKALSAPTCSHNFI